MGKVDVAGRNMPSSCGSTLKTFAHIKVVVRVRPPNAKELEANHRIAIDVIDEQMLIFDPKEVDMPFFYQGVQQPSRGFLKRPNKELKFVFDQVCDQNSSNVNVFEVTTKEILPSLMEGYNCSVFVYGATGAGKTFTMIGNKTEPGITYLTMDHLFQSITSFKVDRDFEIAVSYIEVYNENVYDLLKPSKKPLQLREDTKYGVTVVGLTLHNIKTAQELLQLLENGNRNRTQHPTDANSESSRSHAVFQVYLSMRNKTSSMARMVKLSMIDLAGSERAAATGCVGERFKEGANINRSLLALGNCINKLADGNTYIPYRDSKLTRLLKDSLGGNCRTIMIANVSPSSLSYEDTYNTLKYASRANTIQMSLKKNIVDGNLRVSQYCKINEELLKKVKELEAKLAERIEVVPVSVDNSNWRHRITELESSHSAIEQQMLDLMISVRVLCLRNSVRKHAFSTVMDLAHRSSCEAMEQTCTEDIPRRERANEHYIKQMENLNNQIKQLSCKHRESKQKLSTMLEKASGTDGLKDFIELVKKQAQIRFLTAKNCLKNKLLSVLSNEMMAATNYLSNMPTLLKKLYLILKGYDKMTPSLTNEYLEVVKMVKSGKSISWILDSETNDDTNSVYKLDLSNPCSVPEFDLSALRKGVGVPDVDVENVDPRLSVKKRKGSPLVNDTIVIDDSMENVYANTTMSAKKIKCEMTTKMVNVENYNATIDPKNLNSTFVLAGKLEAIKKEPANSKVIKKGLSDRTNLLPRNNIDKVKPARPALTKKWPTVSRGPGFGSSLSRDGTPLSRQTDAVRARERAQNHPYNRPVVARSIAARQ